jgi:hypothetical protein
VEPAKQRPELLQGVVPARHGIGPLLQRDYWGVIDACRVSPVALMDQVARQFADFAPPQLVSFARLDGSTAPLEVGVDLNVTIAGAGTFGVRVLDREAQSLTLATLSGHPEAGRITFGAYRDERADVIFHIRSRARSGSQKFAMAYAVLGEAMQTNTWTDFIWAVACTFGSGVRGTIHAETMHLSDDDVRQRDEAGAPTFVARGG